MHSAFSELASHVNIYITLNFYNYGKKVYKISFGITWVLFVGIIAAHFGATVDDNTVYNTFDQNRVFLCIRQPISRSVSFDLGYMMVYQQRASGYQYNENHTLRCFFYYRPDFRKHG